MSDVVLEELDRDTCVELLRATTVGRIAFTLDGYPVVFPVNYRMVEDGKAVRLLLRTRSGNVIDRANQRVGFQIDGIDTAQGSGWSVLVRGKMHHLRDPLQKELRESLDAASWPPADRDAWIAIDLVAVTGRRLRAEGEQLWPFDIRGYF